MKVRCYSLSAAAVFVAVACVVDQDSTVKKAVDSGPKAKQEAALQKGGGKGGFGWGKGGFGGGAGTGKATPAERIKVAKDFRVELIYTVPRDKQGSWVSMCL